MTRGDRFLVLVATDGSRHGRAAMAVAARFPWPAEACLQGVVARGSVVRANSVALRLALDRGLERVADDARRVLAAECPGAEVAIVDGPPVEAILRQARRGGADAIVLGSRGHGLVSRLVLGSVSRGVTRRATCPVLVAKGRSTDFTRIVVGMDGSTHARDAVAFLGRLSVPRGGRATVVHVIEPIRPPSMTLMPSTVRGVLAEEMRILATEQAEKARREIEGAATDLRRAGWSVETVVKQGAPLDTLLATVRAGRSHLLVLGARGVGGLERLLLGSVAEGALVHAPVSVLLVR